VTGPRQYTNCHYSQCVYHPAPLTKARASPDLVALTESSLPPSSNRESPDPLRAHQQTTPISPPSMQNPNVHMADEFSGHSSAPTYSFQASPALPATLGAARGTRMLSTNSHKSPDTYTSRDARTGFLGPTAYSAVYTENSGKCIDCSPV
jgi:hypothetical protein